MTINFLDRDMQSCTVGFSTVQQNLEKKPGKIETLRHLCMPFVIRGNICSYLHLKHESVLK
jgi:hypothetical protein